MHVLITISTELNDLQPLRQFMCKRELSVFISAALSIYTDNGVKTLSGRFRENDSRRGSKPSCRRCRDSLLPVSISAWSCTPWLRNVVFCQNEQLKVFRREDTCRPAGGFPSSPQDEDKGMFEAGSCAETPSGVVFLSSGPGLDSRIVSDAAFLPVFVLRQLCLEDSA